MLSQMRSIWVNIICIRVTIWERVAQKMYKVIAFCGDSKLTLGVFHLVDKAVGVACSLFMSCSDCNFGVLSDDGMPIATLFHSASGAAKLAEKKPIL